MRRLAFVALLAVACAHAPDPRISELERRLDAFETWRKAVQPPAEEPPYRSLRAPAGIFLASMPMSAINPGRQFLGQLPPNECTGPSASCSAASFTTTGTVTGQKFVSNNAVGYNGLELLQQQRIAFGATGSDLCDLYYAGGNVVSLLNCGLSVSHATNGTVAGTFFTAAAGSAGKAFAVLTNGAFVDFGAGATDDASSDGTTITYRGPVTVAGQFAVTAGSGNVIITTDSVYAAAYRQKSGVTNAPVKMLSESTDGASAVAGATDTTTAWSTVGAKLHSFRTNAVEKAAITVNGAVNPDFTDDSGTTGNRTVNKPAGINAFAAAGTAITITNSVVKATSLVYAQLQTADATCTFIKSVVPAAGSFVATVNAGCTGTTKMGWIVFNGN